MQPSALSPGRCSLADPFKGTFLCLPAAVIHPVCCSSWQWCMPAEHLLWCAGACVAVCAYISVYVEEAHVRAFGLADVKSALVKHIMPFITDVNLICTSDHHKFSLCHTSYRKHISEMFWRLFFNTSNHFSYLPPINPGTGSKEEEG